jgi:ATP-dependent Clp protease, protease subunit
MATSQQPTRVEVYATFSGTIEQNSLQRLFQGFALTTTPPMTAAHVHLLFESYGGFVGDGVCLYNFFKTLPMELTLYNAGAIQSIATIAYLGARQRKASARATFLIHRTRTEEKGATANRLKARTQSLVLDDEVTESILREHVQLSRKQWRHIENHDLTLSADEAVGIGLADAIAEFSPASGSRLYSI